MRRIRRTWLAAGAALLGACALVVVLGGSSSSGSVPVYEVRKETFVRKIVAEGNLKAVRSTPVVAPGSHMAFKIAWLADDGTWVKKGDVLVRFDPTQSEANLALGEGELMTAQQKIEREKAESGAKISNLGRDVEQFQKEWDSAMTFKSDDPELYSRQEMVQAAIDLKLAEQRERGTESVKSVSSDLAQTNLALLAIERRKADLKLQRAAKEQALLQIAAPHDGFVVFARDWRGDLPQIGQSVWSGFPIAGLPDLSAMEAEVWVLEADAGGLAVGRTAVVTVESNPDVPFAATVRRVDAVPKPRVRGVPVQYFGATLELSRTDRSLMKPGQRVKAVLDLGDVKDALTVPRQAVFETGGRHVVYRRRGSGFTEVEVTLGASSLGRVAVTHGLRDGDVVALRDPTERAEEKRKGRGAAPASPALGAR